MEKNIGMSVTTLGTGGGPVVSSTRAGTGTLIRVDDATYVVDCGMGSIRNYRRGATWDELRGIFLTHLHSDHIYDLGAYLVTGWQVPGESFSRPIDIIGPAKPPQVPELKNADAAYTPELYRNREMTGTVEVVESLLGKCYAADIAIRMVDERRDDPLEWISASDIQLPAHVSDDPVNGRHPAMEPFEIYRDEKVRVTAILVDHRLCYPAFAFRFESKYGSVVVSGDTAYSENCIKLASGADLLLHEVIDLDAMLHTFPPGPKRESIAVHLRESHTEHTEVGKVASEAKVQHLVLHHIVPNAVDAVDLEQMLTVVGSDFDGDLDVAMDGDVFTVSSPGHNLADAHIDEDNLLLAPQGVK